MENHLQKKTLRNVVFETILATVIFILISSCTGQRKLNRLLTKYPNLKQTETIIVRDTIRDTIKAISPGVETLETFDLSRLKDTVYIDTNQLHIRIWTNDSQDTIFVDAKCDTVTIYVPIEIPIEIPVEVEKIIHRKPRDALRWVAITFGLTSLLWIIVFRRDERIRQNKDTST